MLECLQSETNKLTDACEKEVFRIKKQQTMDNAIDYALITMCSDAIELFCPNTDKEKVFDCLKVSCLSTITVQLIINIYVHTEKQKRSGFQ